MSPTVKEQMNWLQIEPDIMSGKIGKVSRSLTYMLVPFQSVCGSASLAEEQGLGKKGVCIWEGWGCREGCKGELQTQEALASKDRSFRFLSIHSYQYERFPETQTFPCFYIFAT